ncbi:MAG: GNAT family N-acetyltransferase [Halobacteriaceae archaeon]
MELRRLPAEEDALRRFAEELWLPYHRELAATVEAHALADGVDLVAEEVAFRRERLESGARAWVAIEDGGALAGDAALAGFVTTSVDESPPVFDRPDRLVVGDIYVREPHRGTGLADRLIDRAAERARASGCDELALDVDVDNERAIAFYEKLGFEPRRRRMVAAAENP